MKSTMNGSHNLLFRNVNAHRRYAGIASGFSSRHFSAAARHPALSARSHRLCDSEYVYPAPANAAWAPPSSPPIWLATVLKLSTSEETNRLAQKKNATTTASTKNAA